MFSTGDPGVKLIPFSTTVVPLMPLWPLGIIGASVGKDENGEASESRQWSFQTKS